MERKPTEARRAQIVETATHILATQGARRFTAQAVATEIGVTPGAIFRHFASMDEILDAAIDRMESILSGDFPEGETEPLARLRTFFQRRVRTIVGNPSVARMLLTDHLAQAGGPERAARAGVFKQRSQRFVLGCLQEAAERGELAGGVRPEVGAVLVQGSILALAHARPRQGRQQGVEALAESVWLVLERALRDPNGRDGRE